MGQAIKQIVIVGGGTAGWLTAGILASQHLSHISSGLNITLIESSEIPTIGVGEGTWPTMRDTLNSIGITEQEFIACCDASFKQGSEFIGWKNGSNSDRYYHPFQAPHGFGQCDLVDYWQQSTQHTSFAHLLSAQPHLCDRHKAPKQLQTPEFAAVANYGYHLNAGKFAELLKRHCTTKLGVVLIDDTVVKVNGQQDQAIISVTTKQHGDVKGDLFVDCSGQSGLLISQHYQIELQSLKHILFNDSAIAVQAPHGTATQPLNSHTISTAHDSGWFWDIALPTRRGIGNVYASDFTSKEQAELDLKQYLTKQLSAKQIDELKFRHLTFAPGYRKRFWVQNCVAIGMSAGFIEPLEASALALVELSAKMLAKELPANNAIMDIASQRFNQRFEYRWQRIVDFLKLHYVLSERQSEYWQAHRHNNSIPEHLRQLLKLWQFQPPSYNDFIQIEEIFPAASYQYILYGMGFVTNARATEQRYTNKLQAERLYQENQQLINKYLNGLPSNRELINQLTANYNQQKAG